MKTIQHWLLNLLYGVFRAHIGLLIGINVGYTRCQMGRESILLFSPPCVCSLYNLFAYNNNMHGLNFIYPYDSLQWSVAA